jgi:hypothetical protein
VFTSCTRSSPHNEITIIDVLTITIIYNLQPIKTKKLMYTKISHVDILLHVSEV